MSETEIQNLIKKIFCISTEEDFREICRNVYNFQLDHLPVFRAYRNLLGMKPDSAVFLPVEFFKSGNLIAEGKTPEVTFRSSGTTGSGDSIHPVADASVYRQSFTTGFRRVYGDEKQYCILALLPSYFERGDSSLVYMMDHLIRQSGHPLSGFYLTNHRELFQTLTELKKQNQKTWLIGTPFSLLDFTEHSPLNFPELILVETGGMKGRREELLKEDLYGILKTRFGVPAVHSEYGMTELLSQAYSVAGGRFRCPPWMKVIIHQATDPFSEAAAGETGLVSVIDLANLYSCSFIRTQDLGRIHPDGTFEIVGRADLSDLRGCSLMTA